MARPSRRYSAVTVMTTNGLLLVDKARAMTSHDVVAQVRLTLNERRVGHAGTLDPLATGLLIVAVGPATRLLRFAQAEVKRYSGTVRLGVATDSLDADGAVVEERPVPELTADAMAHAARRLSGTQQQIPPMVSALKSGGQRLHHLARQGIEVERAPREITVRTFDLAPTEDPAQWNFSVECTTGTYVRVLLSELALSVGTVGHLSALRREGSGPHDVGDAVTLEELAAGVGRGESLLRPPRDFVAHLESVVLDADEERRVRLGQKLPRTDGTDAREVAALSPDGELIGILVGRPTDWKPEVILPAAQSVEGG